MSFAPRCSRSSRMRRFLSSALLLACAQAMACPALLDRSMETIDEQARSLCEYQGKVLLVVNTASQCGYTPQYEGLEALYRKYRGKGLVVLGFPSNDFGGQEPGSNREIAAFCANQYAVDFPVFGKTELGKNPFYAELRKASGQAPRWNFHKYLVDRSGRQVQSFDTRVAPDDPKLIAAIEKLLPSH
jgi:glutathione peroxidase